MDDFGVLCERALPAIYRRARMRVPPEVVDDVVQQTFLSAVQSFHRWRRDASFTTWITAILRYRIADYYRCRAHQPDIVGLDFARGQVACGDRRLQSMVQIVLSTLPERDREVLVLRFGAGLKFKHVAAALGISYEAAKSRYRRAAARFKEVWGEA